LLRATTGRFDQAVVSVRRLQDDSELADDFRATLKDIRNRGEARIVLDCDWHKVQLVLQQVFHCTGLKRRLRKLKPGAFQLAGHVGLPE